MCGVCHEDIGKAFLKSPHEAIEKGDKHGITGNACESCHGPGSKHAETLSPADIRNPSKISAAETERVCMTCHNNQTSNAGRIKASHARNSISCTACHSVHAHGPDGLVARKPAEVNAQCEKLPSRCEGGFCAAVQTPRSRKRDDLRRLPQSARQQRRRRYCGSRMPTIPAASTATATSADLSPSNTP